MPDGRGGVRCAVPARAPEQSECRRAAHDARALRAGDQLRTRDRERKLLKKINETLEKIDEDDYGFCEACGVEIGIRRLEARPTATLCVDCKTLAELKEKQLGG